MLIRTVPPKTFSPAFKSVPKPGVFNLQNGISVYHYNLGLQAVFRLELIFRLGSASIVNPSVAALTGNMLLEGTKGRSAEEINGLLDYHGAFLDVKAGLDYTTITLFGRSEFLSELTPLLREIILEPAFDEKALNKHKQRAIQNLEISQKKTSYWSTRMLRQSVFGTSHPYSRIPSSEKLGEITTSDLTKFHELLVGSLDAVIIAGSFDQEVFDKLVEGNFGQIKILPHSDSVQEPVYATGAQEKKLEHTSQASIALGGKALSILDRDYPVHSFIMKILGGYFGSRLMKNLREEKGLTYGIHAYFLQLRHGDFFQIASDVKLEAVDESIDTVKAEIERLLTSPIEEAEIDTVKNYMLGEYVNDSNTAFDYAGLYKKIILQQLPEDFFDNFYERISAVSVEEVESTKAEVIDPALLSVVKVF